MKILNQIILPFVATSTPIQFDNGIHGQQPKIEFLIAHLPFKPERLFDSIRNIEFIENLIKVYVYERIQRPPKSETEYRKSSRGEIYA